jgi:hypothetical protein
MLTSAPSVDAMRKPYPFFAMPASSLLSIAPLLAMRALKPHYLASVPPILLARASAEWCCNDKQCRELFAKSEEGIEKLFSVADSKIAGANE